MGTRMKPQAKLRPGDLMIISGMLAVLGGAIWLLLVLFGDLPEYRAMRNEGRTVAGQIVGKQSELSAGARRQRKSASENFYFEVTFDPARGHPFGGTSPAMSPAPRPTAPRSGQDIVASLKIGGGGAGSPVVAGGAVRVRVNAGSFERFEAHRIGDAISLSYLPGDPAGARLTEIAQSESPWTSFSAAVALLVTGIGLCLLGFRRRNASITSGPSGM